MCRCWRGRGARLSLAGAQAKLPVVLVNGQIAGPRPGELSTHLIKPEPARFPGLADNEAFCLTLASAVGLDAANGKWREVRGKALLLVERYDRTTGQERVHRLHQEDFAQALGVPTNRKYAAEGGPTFRDAFALLRRAATRPAREILKLADTALFKVIVGNANAHAKNFSLLRREGGAVVLAPFYDLVPTRVWEELSARLAMRFGGAARLEKIDAESLNRFAADAGLATPYLRRRAVALSSAVEAALGLGVRVPGLPEGAITALAAATADRATRHALKAGSRS